MYYSLSSWMNIVLGIVACGVSYVLTISDNSSEVSCVSVDVFPARKASDVLYKYISVWRYLYCVRGFIRASNNYVSTDNWHIIEVELWHPLERKIRLEVIEEP